MNETLSLPKHVGYETLMRTPLAKEVDSGVVEQEIVRATKAELAPYKPEGALHDQTRISGVSENVQIFAFLILGITAFGLFVPQDVKFIPAGFDVVLGSIGIFTSLKAGTEKLREVRKTITENMQMRTVWKYIPPEARIQLQAPPTVLESANATNSDSLTRTLVAGTMGYLIGKELSDKK